MKASLAIATVVLALSVAATAQAARTFSYDAELAFVARESLLRSVTSGPEISRTQIQPVRVRCYFDKRSFERTFEGRFGLSARSVIAYYAGGADVHLRDTTCENVRHFLSGRHTVHTAAAFSILLHEALHRQGVKNERVTTCLANDAVRWGALWFGFEQEQAVRARNLAFAFTRLFSPAEYRMGKPNCLLLSRRTDWVDHRLPDH